MGMKSIIVTVPSLLQGGGNYKRLIAGSRDLGSHLRFLGDVSNQGL